MKLIIKSFSGEELFKIKCKKTYSVYSVIIKCRKEMPNIFKLVSFVPVYRELNQLKSVEEEGITKNEELYIIVNDKLQDTINNLTQNGNALQYVSDELKNDKEVVLAAITEDGRALEYASDELKNDKEVVLAAVTQYGRALEYASDELKNDKDVVLAAVTEDGWALQYSSDEEGITKNDELYIIVNDK